MQQYMDFASQNILMVGLFFFLLAMIVITEFKRLTRKYKEVGTHEAVRIINQDDGLILDVREKKSLADGVIEGSLHMPLSALAKRSSEISKFKDKPVLIYCDAGIRSGQAAETLSKQGFEQVSSLKGGYAAWKSDNMPTVRA